MTADVQEGREDEFLGLVRRLDEVLVRKRYAQADTIRDEASSSRFYAVRRWVSADAARQSHADPEVNALAAQLSEIALINHVINGVRRTIDLVGAARRARENAAAAFSRFKVGAALETTDGTIIAGCNVENATYGLSVCAEQVAVLKALSEGHRHFTRIAIVADTDQPTPPCGACRQILWECCGNLEIRLANLTKETGTHRLADLLPLPFDARLL